MLTATVTVDLDHVDDGYFGDVDRDDRYALMHLDEMPNGTRLVVNVGQRDLILHSARQWLGEAASRLEIEIVAASPQVARKWLEAIRGGDDV